MSSSPYEYKPPRLLTKIYSDLSGDSQRDSYCAGFELQEWRCKALADHLIEWIADYALREDELRVHHGNMFVRLREAAARIYRSDKYQRRGEIGELLLHAICRDFFDTIPFAPRVFYLTASNDVVKSFDLVHVRYLAEGSFQIWLGEAKFYEDRNAAIAAAIESVKVHIDQGFLNNEKLLLGPQISNTIPLYREIRELFSIQTSLDSLFKNAVFPVCIAADCKAASDHEEICDDYIEEVRRELTELVEKLSTSGLETKIKILLIYVPLASKAALADAFDANLKALSR